MATTPGITDGRPFISLNGVSLCLRDRTVFGRTDWEILDDQHWAVIGPNGSGKSLLMKALCGQVPIAGGRIVYHFAEEYRSPERVRPQDQVAYVAFDRQKAALAPIGRFYQARWNAGIDGDSLLVSEYLSVDRVQKRYPYEVGEEQRDVAAYEARQARVVALLGIEELLDKRLLHLSDGERRKTFLARALLRQPRLLILDNPFAGLDQRFRARLRRIIRELMQDDMRLILATAHHDEVPSEVTHVLSVQEHRVVAQGPRGAILGDGGARNPPSASFAPIPPADLPLERPPTSGGPVTPVLVHMENVNVSYGDFYALHDIRWTVRQGEHWALLGPNGSGKTTLLSLILGDHPQAYANEVTLFGRPRGSGESIWELKRQIGWVAPELHLYYPRGSSCLDVVCSGFFDSVGLYQRCSSQQREAARSWLRYLGLAQRADTDLADLSEGEQRLALLARALVKRPLLLVLDEPCQGLDAGNRDRVLAAVDAIGSQLDATVIYVTHQADELPRIITHVLRLDRGRIESQGPRGA